MKSGTLVAVSLWRLVIVVFAFVGAGTAVADLNDPWPGLSLQASVLTGVVYLGLLLYPLFARGRHEPRSPWWRGAMAVLLILVALTYLLIMQESIDETWSLFEHVLTPLIVVIDWIAVGANQVNARWWYPLTWVVFPLAYLVYFLIADPGLYSAFLDPQDSAFAGTVAGFLFGLLAAGYLLYGIARLRAAATTRPPAYQEAVP